jgi:hypothetical protein
VLKHPDNLFQDGDVRFPCDDGIDERRLRRFFFRGNGGARHEKKHEGPGINNTLYTSHDVGRSFKNGNAVRSLPRQKEEKCSPRRHRYSNNNIVSFQENNCIFIEPPVVFLFILHSEKNNIPHTGMSAIGKGMGRVAREPIRRNRGY